MTWNEWMHRNMLDHMTQIDKEEDEIMTTPSQFLPEHIEMFFDRETGNTVEVDIHDGVVAESAGHMQTTHVGLFNMLITYMHQGRKLWKFTTYDRWEQIRDINNAG